MKYEWKVEYVEAHYLASFARALQSRLNDLETDGYIVVSVSKPQNCTPKPSSSGLAGSRQVYLQTEIGCLIRARKKVK